MAERPSASLADADLIERTRAALDAWAARADGSTSSITGGGAIRCLEEAMAQRLGRPTVALGSGTAALAACLIGVGVRPGSHVITSALDWPAASDAIRWIGATPVYADVDPVTMTLDPESVAAAVGPATAAVVATHLFGIPADVPAIRAALVDRVPVVEDCAQAVSATLDGRQAGTLGDAAAFSLGPGKQVDAGEGGMAAFADPDAWDRAVVATQHRVRALATAKPALNMFLPSRLHPLAAVLALPELATVDVRTAARQAAVTAWADDHPAHRVAGLDARRRPAWWQVPVSMTARQSTRDEEPAADEDPSILTAPLCLTVPPRTSDDRPYPGARAALAAYRLIPLPATERTPRERSHPTDRTSPEDRR